MREQLSPREQHRNVVQEFANMIGQQQWFCELPDGGTTGLSRELYEAAPDRRKLLEIICPGRKP